VGISGGFYIIDSGLVFTAAGRIVLGRKSQTVIRVVVGQQRDV
jgi:hypothetical protein